MDPQESQKIHLNWFVKVICIGAETSGLLLACNLQKHFEQLSLTVRTHSCDYEPNAKEGLRYMTGTRKFQELGTKIGILGMSSDFGQLALTYIDQRTIILTYSTQSTIGRPCMLAHQKSKVTSNTFVTNTILANMSRHRTLSTMHDRMKRAGSGKLKL